MPPLNSQTKYVFECVREVFSKTSPLKPVFDVNGYLTTSSENPRGGATFEEVANVMMELADPLRLSFDLGDGVRYAGFWCGRGAKVTVVGNHGHFSVLWLPGNGSAVFVPVAGDGYCAVWAVTTAVMIASADLDMKQRNELMLGSEEFPIDELIKDEVVGLAFPRCVLPRDLDAQAALIAELDEETPPCRGFRRLTAAVGASGGGSAPAASAGGGPPSQEHVDAYGATAFAKEAIDLVTAIKAIEAAEAAERAAQEAANEAFARNLVEELGDQWQ